MAKFPIKLFIKKTNTEPVVYLIDSNHKLLNVIFSTYDALDDLLDSLILHYEVMEINFFKDKIIFS